ncbi:MULTISPECIES: ABC transporter ATP-binding protein [Kitasatospora]|uniref:ATP-binding cassette domain-containing protein n=1 Tax=Kitasatospora cystarginea TaxID=58350 RepID=A0ABP5Q833_9ACTN
MTDIREARIVVEGLRKSFRLRPAGGRWFRRAADRTAGEVTAVDGIGFHIEPGEVVGFLGPNGAGKTTTLKLLSGLLHPTAGEVRVGGYRPADRDRDFLRSIAFVMGQRQQLVWDIPIKDSLELNRIVYRVPDGEFRRTRQELVEMLELGPLLGRTARTLSLGQRMRCEIAASLIHCPSLLFLDEPTLGLDISMQRRIRTFVREHNRRRGTTVLLTSHYMGDIAELCDRALVIHEGGLVYDGGLDALRARIAPFKRISVKLRGGAAELGSLGTVVSQSSEEAEIRVESTAAPDAVARLLAIDQVYDFQVMDPSLEDVIGQFFTEGLSR